MSESSPPHNPLGQDPCDPQTHPAAMEPTQPPPPLPPETPEMPTLSDARAGLVDASAPSLPPAPRQRAQATPLRVEKLAKEKLQMRTATPAITQYVTYSEPATASVGALSTDRPPVGAKAPPGGSAAREAANVVAISR